MSRFLFCTTDTSGFREDVLDYSFNYQNSGFLDLAPDYYGLQSWDEFTPVFSNYDLVWLHLNPRVMHPAWYEYAKLIRYKAPDTKIIISHEYFEKYHIESIPFFLTDCLGYADYIQVNTRVAYHIFAPRFEDKVLLTNLSIPIREPEGGFPEPIPWEDKDGVVLIEHTVPTPLVQSFEILRDTGLNATLISSNPTHEASWWNHYVQAYDIQAETYGRLSPEEYMNKLNGARVGLEYGYTGICRFAYECAKVNTPVVGHNRLEYRNKLYPKLTALNTKSAVTKLLRVHNEESYAKDLNSYANKVMNTYWSEESVQKRVNGTLRKMKIRST